MWDFFIQTCLGVQYLHTRRILHRDLKTINLFLSKAGRLKIGDLGVAKEVKETHTETIVGTPYYLSPELCEEKPYNNKSDIWSLGCILYELCTLKHPFDAKTQGGLFLKIIKGSYQPISSIYSKSLSDIIHKCLQKNCKDRPSIQQILENDELIEQAIQLGYEIPTEEEILGLIKGQKRDFMTTFAKKKQAKGSSSTTGSVGLVSNEKLKNKHVGATNIKNNPPEKPRRAGKPLISANKYKAQSRSAVVDAKDISNDVISKVDRLAAGGSDEKKKPSIQSKYDKESKGSKISARGIYNRKLSPANAGADKSSNSSKKEVSTKSTPGKPGQPQRPKSNYQPKRAYNKPWQRSNTVEEVKETKPTETNGKKREDKSKKAIDSGPGPSRKKPIRPVVIKKDLIDEPDEFEPPVQEPKKQRAS